MKKTLLLAAALVLSTSVVGAQESTDTSSAKPTPIRVEARTNIGERATVKLETGVSPIERREEAKARFDEKKQEVGARMEARASTTEAKREEMRAKVEGRIETREAKMGERASSTEARREEAKEKMEQRVEKRASSTEARVEARKEKMEDRLSASIKNTSEYLSKVLGRLVEIKTKIAERISKIEGEGKDVTEARSNLATAEAKLEAAKTSVQAVAALEVNTADIKSSFDTLKKTVLAAQTSLREAQASLNMVVQGMKSAK